MGDMGEIFNAMKEASQKRRASHRGNAPLLLLKADIQYESKNCGAHLIVNGCIDFWPGTGLWIVRGEKEKHYGIKKLITYIAQHQELK